MDQQENCKLSVIVPIYNGEKDLPRLMESVLSQQDFSDYEVILVDDGSKDGTWRLCQELAKKDKKVHAIHTDNHGVSHARNTGLDKAKGIWIQFIDADDVIREDTFAGFWRAVNEKETDLAVCGGVRKVISDGSVTKWGPMETKYLDFEEVQKQFDHLSMEDRHWFTEYGVNKWYRREIIERNRLRFREDLSLGEDFVFQSQYYRDVASIYLLAEPYYTYLFKDTGLVGSFRPEPWKKSAVLFEEQQKLYEHRRLWENNEKHLRRQAGQIAFGDIRTINYRSCRYSAGEKLEFVGRMIKTEQFELCLEYLRERRELRFRLYRPVFESKNKYLIYGLIRLEGFLGKRA